MPRRSPGSVRSTRLTLLGADGRIDLSGEQTGHPAETPASPDGAFDAWAMDRSRRSMIPPAEEIFVREPQPTQRPIGDHAAQEIVDRFALGDHQGALRIAELQLGLDPADERALHYALESRRRLEMRYVARIGSLDDVFNGAVPPAKLRWSGLDPQATSLLTLIDGQASVQQVLDLCRMTRLEALRLFIELLEAQAIVRVA